MINSIEVNNFQSHKHTVLEFHPGVNVIIGPSDSGKSGLLRSLKWPITNRPSGSDIRSWWGGKTEVKLSFDNGDVTRSKDKIEEYILKKPKKKPLVLHAFKTVVPDSISEFINMTEINMQAQIEPPFLLSKTSGEVATYFNKVANLDKIDIAQATINGLINDITSSIKHKKEDKVDYEADLLNYDHLQEMEMDVEVLEGLDNHVRIVRNRITQLTALLKKISEVTEEMDEYTDLISLSPLIEVTLAQIEARKTIKENGGKLFGIVELLNEVNEDITNCEEWVEIGPTLNEVLTNMEKRDDLQSKEHSLNILINDYNNVMEVMGFAENDASMDKSVSTILAKLAEKQTKLTAISTLKNAITDFKGINTQLKDATANLGLFHNEFHTAMPDICPLCDTVLTKKK